MAQNMRTCFVTGASSGVGAAIAGHLAQPGTTLILQARNAARLAEVGDACRRAGATIEIACGDLSDNDALLRFAADVGGRSIDEAYLCAGLGEMRAPGRKVEDARATFAVASVNFTATVTLATAIANAMEVRGRGQIVMIGSVAGAFALAMAPTYSASKAGLKIFAESLGNGLAAHGVGVTHVALGFVDTPMSQRLECWKPGMLTPETAARRIVEAARKNSRSVSIPAWFGPVQWVGRIVPPVLLRGIVARLSVAQNPRS